MRSSEAAVSLTKPEENIQKVEQLHLLSEKEKVFYGKKDSLLLAIKILYSHKFTDIYFNQLFKAYFTFPKGPLHLFIQVQCFCSITFT